MSGFKTTCGTLLFAPQGRSILCQGMKPRTSKAESKYFQRVDKPNYDPGTGQIISRVEGSPYIPKGKATRVRKSSAAPPLANGPKSPVPRKREKPNYDPGTGQILSRVEGSPYIPKGIISRPATDPPPVPVWPNRPGKPRSQ